MSKGLFITGTGTDVGKTYVTALIIKQLRDAGMNAGYYKAAISGAEERCGKLWAGDAMLVKEKARLEEPQKVLVSYVYKEAVSPHLAAKIHHIPINLSVIERGFEKAAATYDYVTVEGSGGIVCPLRYDGVTILLEDVVKLLKLPSLIVADAGLGAINDIVLTAEYMRRRNMEVRGILLNHYQEDSLLDRDNKYMVEQLTQLPVIATIAEGATALSAAADVIAKLYRKVR